jgi:hypothetical protein
VLQLFPLALGHFQSHFVLIDIFVAQYLLEYELVPPKLDVVFHLLLAEALDLVGRGLELPHVLSLAVELLVVDVRSLDVVFVLLL